ncbi:hypothetical protein [Dyella jiangningensis]|uniref:Uncharacterized protein n=1 Tax=Dyella jiangningensis TaxID=1379159 RepID=A0A328P1X9_9GAMM|nr:hypothetical protein [Dyella jiangningensis]RAO74996.1 hypothetical protein CA260_12830 [Dyella jiangningensis]
MWANFWAMPKLLRLMTGHALACVTFLVMSVVPNDSFAIEGRHVSQAEWWSSGAGPFASLVGIFGLLAGVSLLRKARWARFLYLAFATVGLVIPYPVMGNPTLGLVGLLLVAAAAVYLFKAQGAVSYFEQEIPRKIGN